MTVYISGAITGCENTNHFDEAAQMLKKDGYEVIIPYNLYKIYGEPTNTTWQTWMKRAIRLMMEADAVFMCDGWENSKGAAIENNLAKSLGYPILYMKNFHALVIEQNKT